VDSLPRLVGLVWVLAATWQLSLNSPDEPVELSQCLKRDDSTINIFLVIIIIITLQDVSLGTTCEDHENLAAVVDSYLIRSSQARIAVVDVAKVPSSLRKMKRRTFLV